MFDVASPGHLLILLIVVAVYAVSFVPAYREARAGHTAWPWALAALFFGPWVLLAWFFVAAGRRHTTTNTR
jgi:hypothetical protein